MLGLFASYALLLPGLFGVLFSFNLLINVYSVRIDVIRPGGHPGPLTDSTWSLISLLFRTGSAFGGFLVILYGMVVPAAKLLLLAIGEYLRYSKVPFRVGVARGCIAIVQVISKWASPDMFAYILLLYLFRSLNHPGIMEAAAHLDVGFACMAGFCVFSTLFAHCIELPGEPSRVTKRMSAFMLKRVFGVLAV